ncbi:Transcription intermediary factor 1-alpha [Branchiostoma belcheri]|nr:Transcription intermediary factor 1-alpha [Branchiostoma belcheri]
MKFKVAVASTRAAGTDLKRTSQKQSQTTNAQACPYLGDFYRAAQLVLVAIGYNIFQVSSFALSCLIVEQIFAECEYTHQFSSVHPYGDATYCLHKFLFHIAEDSSSPSRPISSSIHIQPKVKCPKCHAEAHISELIDNFFLQDSKAQREDNQPNSDPQCTSCEENAPATAFCEDCSDWLCEACVQAHGRVKVTKEHKLQNKEEALATQAEMASQRPLFCPLHRQEQLKLYCETCDKLTCRDCQLLEHKEHRYAFVNEASQNHKQFLQTLVEKLQEKKSYIQMARAKIRERYRDVQETEKKMVQEIKAFMFMLITEINKRGKQLLTELQVTTKDRMNKLKAQDEEILRLSMAVDHCANFANFAMNLGNNTALLYSKRHITNQLKNILRTRCEPNPCVPSNMKFMVDSTFVAQYISRLGALLAEGDQIQRVQTPSSELLTGVLLLAAICSQSQLQQQMSPGAAAAAFQQNKQLQGFTGPQQQVPTSSGLVNLNSLPKLLSVPPLTQEQLQTLAQKAANLANLQRAQPSRQQLQYVLPTCWSKTT